MAQTWRHRQLRYNIVNQHLPGAIVRFLEKNGDYGDGSDEFGPRGQIMEISGKYRKLKAAVWDGQVLVGEPVEEIIDDMIAHLLLLKEQVTDTLAPATDWPPFDYVDWAQCYAMAMKDMFEQATADG
jgi:hypothetical protein